MMEDDLGFIPALPPVPSPQDSVRTALFRGKRQLVGLVFDAAQLEGSPYTFAEVHTLLDGITVGGHRLSDERLILNLRDAWKTVFGWVATRSFRLDKSTFCALHAKVGFEEALVWGAFRDGPVSIQGTQNRLPAPQDLPAVFDQGIRVLEAMHHPYHQAINFFLFGSLHQFFFDGNKRTARLMASGHLLSNGFDALTIPAARRLEFNQGMIDFYDTRDGTAIGTFLRSLHEDV